MDLNIRGPMVSRDRKGPDSWKCTVNPFPLKGRIPSITALMDSSQRLDLAGNSNGSPNHFADFTSILFCRGQHLRFLVIQDLPYALIKFGNILECFNHLMRELLKTPNLAIINEGRDRNLRDNFLKTPNQNRIHNINHHNTHGTTLNSSITRKNVPTKKGTNFETLNLIGVKSQNGPTNQGGQPHTLSNANCHLGYHEVETFQPIDKNCYSFLFLSLPFLLCICSLCRRIGVPFSLLLFPFLVLLCKCAWWWPVWPPPTAVAF